MLSGSSGLPIRKCPGYAAVWVPSPATFVQAPRPQARTRTSRAAAAESAVVSAYWNEVVNFEQQQQQKRLTELQKLHAEKEIEVRNKREQLKRELENIGAGDDQTMRARTELAVCVYLDFQREFQRMKLEHRTLVGKLAEAKQTYGELQDVEIAEAEVLSLLYGDPVYHDLRSRLANLQSNRPRTNTVGPGTTPPPGPDQTQVELNATKAQLQELEDHARDLVRARNASP